MIKILIDRSTVRKNPHYGVGMTQVIQGIASCKLSGSFIVGDKISERDDFESFCNGLDEVLKPYLFFVEKIGTTNGIGIFECKDIVVIKEGETAKERDIEVIGKELLAYCESKGCGLVPSTLKYEMSREAVQSPSTHAPQKYIYIYVPTMVKCKECAMEFVHGDLTCDCVVDGDDECFNDKVCPHCGAWDCCEIEYEDFDEEMARNFPMYIRLGEDNNGTTMRKRREENGVAWYYRDNGCWELTAIIDKDGNVVSDNQNHCDHLKGIKAREITGEEWAIENVNFNNF